MELSILSSFKVCRKKFCDICKMLEKILCKPIVTVMMTVCWENFEAYGANVMRLLFAIFFFFFEGRTQTITFHRGLARALFQLVVMERLVGIPWKKKLC